MKMNVIEKGERLEVNLLFSDGRAIDLEISLHLACRERGWQLTKVESTFQHDVYHVEANESYLTTLHFTSGWEPPTRAMFENKPNGADEYWESAKGTTLEVAREFLKESAHRFLLTSRALDKALMELRPKSIAS
jgi:hypothetical protein